jgi:hypothetical protein
VDPEAQVDKDISNNEMPDHYSTVSTYNPIQSTPSVQFATDTPSYAAAPTIYGDAHPAQQQFAIEDEDL